MTQTTSSHPTPAAKFRVPQPDGLRRERLVELLGGATATGLAVVVAPPGAGKTTTLSHVAAAFDGDVCWYRAEASDASEIGIVSALSRALLGPGTPSINVDGLVEHLEQQPRRVLIVIDDAHALWGTPGAVVLDRFLGHVPDSVAVVVASRTEPGIDVTRRRLERRLVEVNAEHLRFRSWEVERLFSEHFREPMPPEDLAQLARSTGGWAAGLTLFHLATTGRPAPERRRVLTAAGGRSRLVRSYLARNVLDVLPPDVRSFLVRTSVLGTLSGPLCDRLLDTAGSASVLADLTDRRLFTSTDDDGATYRYHEVLRAHLEAELTDEIGEAATADWYRHAGLLLEDTGAVSDAMRAFCRAGDWVAVQRLVGNGGRALAADSGEWVDFLPPGMVERDPWVLLTQSRRLVAAGQLDAAGERYGQAHDAFAGHPADTACRTERQALASWLEPAALPPTGWIGILRAATRRSPAAAAALAGNVPGAEGHLTRAVALILAGRLPEGRAELRRGRDDPEAGPLLWTVSELIDATLMALAGTPGARTRLEAATGAADRLEQLPWLARLAPVALGCLRGTYTDQTGDVLTACERAGDSWGAAVVELLQGLAALDHATDAEGLDRAATRFHQLDAGVLASWAESAAAYVRARAGDPDASSVARRALATSERIVADGPHALALAALAESPGATDTDRVRATAALGDTDLHAWFNGTAPPEPNAAPRVEVRCFDGFRVLVDGEEIGLDGLKPRARQVLRLLAAHAPRSVHRDVIVEWLWHDVEPTQASRSLQVGISSIRGALGDVTGNGADIVARVGDGYRLTLPEGSEVDVAAFQAALDASRHAGPNRPALLRRALDLYRGDLLPEDATEDWAVARRDELRSAATDAALDLATLELEVGHVREAASAARRGLRCDPYSDPLRRLQIEALERAGDHAAAAQARQAYREVLDSLGVSAAS